jgi:hypothetical protein
MMNFLRSLFGGPRGSAADRSGLYVYVRPTGCDEVIRVRINLLNDLSDLAFDGQRRIREQHITGGEFVDAAAYEAWLQASPPPAAP